MTNEEFEEINNYAHKTSGLIIETGAILETFINTAIAYYFCNDDNKVDDFNAFIQEVSIQQRILYYKIVLSELDQQQLTKPLKFQFLETSKDVKAKNIIEGIKAFNTLRNKFAHSMVEPVQKDISKNELIFCLMEFKPRTNNGLKSETPLNKILEKFSNLDFELLKSDFLVMRNIMSNFHYKIKESCVRIPLK